MIDTVTYPSAVEVGSPEYQALQARIAESNLDPTTFLGTDFLNHFNEIVMLLDMIPDMPEILEDAKAWQPKSYCDHFRDSTIADRELAVEVFESVPVLYREPFERTIQQIDRTIDTAVEVLERDMETGNIDLMRVNASALSRVIQRLMDTASAIIHGSDQALDQSEIDDLLGM